MIKKLTCKKKYNNPDKKPMSAVKFLLIFLAFSLFSLKTYATQNDCYKIFPQEPDVLFMSAISAISSSSSYGLNEIQSKNGYILFTKGSKFYLLTLTKKYKNQTEIKILPQNSAYQDSSEVARSVFSLIENQLKHKKMEQAK